MLEGKVLIASPARTVLASAVLIGVADQISKLFIRANLAVGESLPSDGPVRLTHVTNEGIVFGLPAPAFLTILMPILVTAAMVYLVVKSGVLYSRMVRIALGLFVGGSLGNLVDRLHQGHVTDFIDVRLWGSFHWPAFNVADAAIVVSVALGLYFLLVHMRKSTTNS